MTIRIFRKEEKKEKKEGKDRWKFEVGDELINWVEMEKGSLGGKGVVVYMARIVRWTA